MRNATYLAALMLSITTATASEVYTVDGDEPFQWTNFASAPIASKNDRSFKLLMHKGDEKNYYLYLVKRDPQPCTVQIGEELFEIPGNGKRVGARVLMVTPQKWVSDPGQFWILKATSRYSYNYNR